MKNPETIYKLAFVALITCLLLVFMPASAPAQGTLKKCPKNQSQRFHNCEGKYTYPKGGIYEGEWQNDKRNGFGTYTFKNGQVYTGQWRADKRHGHGTYTFPDGEEYVGDFVNGDYHGFGSITFPDGGNYTGNWKNDEKSGRGTYIFPDGAKYVGIYLKGKRNGEGVYTFANGNKYEGNFKDGTYDGYGTFTFASGKHYIGEFKDNDYHGRGTLYAADGSVIESGMYEKDVLVTSLDPDNSSSNTQNLASTNQAYTSNLKACPTDQSKKFHDCQGKYTYPKGGIYEGEWQNDKRNGYGTYSFKNGQQYTGQWRNDKRHGNGTYTFPDGEEYVGEFANGDYHGFGTISFPDGGVYKGNWVKDEKSGQGTYIFPDGAKYVGLYKNGKRNGLGVYTFANDNKYEGNFKDGAYEGHGTFTFASGKHYIGEFKDNDYHGRGTMFAADGSVIESGIYEKDVLVTKLDPDTVTTSDTNVANIDQANGSNLKACPKDQSKRFHNCFGEYTYPKGGVYKGDWQDDKRNGMGTYLFKSGQQYTGQWKNDKRHGQGKYTFPDGENYFGEFALGDYHGFGTLTFPDGGVYKGNWVKDEKSGQGTYTFPDGATYVGQYRNGKRNGQGVYTFANGNVYEGNFKDGAYDGQGKFTFASGKHYIGEFKDNDYHGRGTMYAADGSVLESGTYAKDELVTSLEPDAATDSTTAVTTQNALNSSQNKVALVIGNQSYINAAALKNPGNDARSIAAMLTNMGFTVVSGIDMDKQSLDGKIREFITSAQTADIALFYYAGHAVQVAGQNYMVPIGAQVDHPSAIDFELVNMSVVSNYMGGRDRVGIILLDACRNNPFTKSLSRSMTATRSAQVSSGLAPVISQGGGLLIGFATAPNDVAGDGEGNNSPFATGLLKHLPTRGLEIELAMKRVKADVISMTDNTQRPWHNSDLAKEVFLLGN